MYEIIGQDGTFLREINITYDNIDYNLLLKPQAAAQMCQNIAVGHSDKAGYTVDYFRKSQTGWALTGWHLIFTNRPKENEKFTLTTWTKPFKRLQADRSFIARDKDGNELFRAASRWFLMDMKKRRPIRLPEGFFSKYVPAKHENAIPDEDYKQPDLKLYQLKGNRNFNVTRRDIDANNHTNNVSYIDWAIDDLTDEIYLNYTILDLKAEYKKEARLGDTVNSSFYMRKLDDDILEVSSVFTYEQNTDQMLCRVTTQWKKANAQN